MRALLLLLFILAGCTAPATPSWAPEDFVCDFETPEGREIACEPMSIEPEISLERPSEWDVACMATWEDTWSDEQPPKIDMMRVRDEDAIIVGLPEGHVPDRDLVIAFYPNHRGTPFTVAWQPGSEPQWIKVGSMTGDFVEVGIWSYLIGWEEGESRESLTVIHDSRFSVEHKNWLPWVVVEPEGNYALASYVSTMAPDGDYGTTTKDVRLPRGDELQPVTVWTKWWTRLGDIYYDRDGEGCDMEPILPLPPGFEATDQVI